MRLDDYLSQFEDLRSLYEEAKQAFLAKGLVHHNWNHILRDLARGIVIGEAEGADMRIVLASILLHDIGRLSPEEGKDHHTVGAEMAPRYLGRVRFTQGDIEGIKHCIRAHGPRGIEEPRTLEGKVCYDVNVLSCSVGYIGVARVFDYFMREEGMNVKQMVEMPSGKKGPREDFYTESGRDLGERGLQKARDFWKGLEQEFAEEERMTRGIILSYEAD